MKQSVKLKGLLHETINERKKQRVKRGIYHLQHVNNFHNRLKRWMERFQGVGTYYLDNDLYWFRWLELGKGMAFDKRVEQLLISACQSSNYNTVEMLRSYY